MSCCSTGVFIGHVLTKDTLRVTKGFLFWIENNEATLYIVTISCNQSLNNFVKIIEKRYALFFL